MYSRTKCDISCSLNFNYQHFKGAYLIPKMTIFIEMYEKISLINETKCNYSYNFENAII